MTARLKAGTRWPCAMKVGMTAGMSRRRSSSWICWLVYQADKLICKPGQVKPGKYLQPPLQTRGKTNAVSQSGTDQSQQSDLSQTFEHATPEMVRCGEDEIAFHIPESVKRKIRRHEFVNLAVFLKGGVELAELYGSNLLSINEKGQLEIKPKPVTDKMNGQMPF